MSDDIINPPHYTQGNIECIEAIKSALTPEEFRGHLKATAIAYLWREKHKGGDVDIEKAYWYIGKIIDSIKIPHTYKEHFHSPYDDMPMEEK